MSVYDRGHVLGAYELIELIGRGGMGEVWLARHVPDDARVAIKIVFPRPDRRKEAAERFEREVAAAARIDHPAIVRVHDCGTDALGGSMFLVMELLHGSSLRAWLTSAPRTALEALRLIRELLDALAAAHACEENGRAAPIIHRDLKPENVFVLDPPIDGRRVKLLDFGIARQSGGNAVTDTGVGMGTAAYMSPEQATDAREVLPAADVWSIGVMLYEILAARLPFDAASRNEIITKILTREPVPLRELAPNVPRRLARLVGSCLAKEPDVRPRDASELLRELDEVFSDPDACRAIEALEIGREPRESGAARSSPHGATTRDPARKTKRLAWMTALFAIALATALAIAWSSTRPERPTTTFSHPEVAPDAGPRVDPSVQPLNRWIRVEPAGEVVLGVGDREIQSGFQPSANVRAPESAYELQQHEVTWGELEPWLARRGEMLPVLNEARPPWLAPDAATRARLPATSVDWTIARDYCLAIGGSLPTEEQWEYAARGSELRRYAWGDAEPDSNLVHIGPMPDAHPVEVMTSEQDRTPGSSESAIWDLMGNAREWTLDHWRSPTDGSVHRFPESEGRTFRAVRGLPLSSVSSIWQPPASAPAAFRTPLCASGPCPEGTNEVLLDVGFRCARP